MTLVKLNNRRLPGTFDALFNDFFSAVPSLWQEDHLRVPPVNVSETKDGYQLEVVAPGLNKEELSVNVENGLLTVAWEKKEQNEDQQAESAKTLRREYTYRSFKRTFTVDESIDTEHIDAKYENGVLRIYLPKNEPAKPGSRQIAIQ